MGSAGGKNGALNIIVPDDLVSRLIGKNGETVKNLMNRTKTTINYFKEGNNPAVSTTEGQKGRLCTIKGKSADVAQAVELILADIHKHDSF